MASLITSAVGDLRFLLSSSLPSSTSSLSLSSLLGVPAHLWSLLLALPPQRRYAVLALLSTTLFASRAAVRTILGSNNKKGKSIFGDYDTMQRSLPTGDYYDVAIVGAGPSGSSCAYYLSKAGRRVLLLEKKQFPRDKFCGDAVSEMAQNHLREMGVLQEIMAENKGFFAAVGGFVSPNGYSFIGNSGKELNNDGPAVAIKRYILDEKIAKAAKRMGADLKENSPVANATFDKSSGLWTIYICKEDEPDTIVQTYKARVLVCADGAPSKLARQLNLVSEDQSSIGVCSRAFVKPGTHNFKADGVVFYPKALLPGYAAIFRHVGDELNFCTYIIPGGKVTNDDLSDMHHSLLNNDPYVTKALGPNFEIERMKAASLRLGGIPKSFSDHVLIVGDAAGMIDPLTGEGIQYALDSGKLASDTLVEALASGNLSAASLSKYQDRWMTSYGREFYWSMKMSLLLYRYPFILDGCARLIQKKGADYLAEWALVMTGERSKLWFLRPDVGIPIFIEILKVWVEQNVWGKKPAAIASK